MEKIMDLLNNLDDLGKFVPKLDSVMDLVLKLTKLAVRVGPVCILVLGLIYLLIPPKEANYKAGYRTFFGMGSIAAWRFTQFVSGIIMTVMGLILNIIATRAVAEFPGMVSDLMIDKAIDLIKVQVICVITLYVFMFVLTMLMFTVKGDLRIRALRKTLLEKVLFDEHPKRLILMTLGMPVKEPKKSTERRKKPEFSSAQTSQENGDGQSEEALTEYERQGEQKITAEDIVIEGL